MRAVEVDHAPGGVPGQRLDERHEVRDVVDHVVAHDDVGRRGAWRLLRPEAEEGLRRLPGIRDPLRGDRPDRGQQVVDVVAGEAVPPEPVPATSVLCCSRWVWRWFCPR